MSFEKDCLSRRLFLNSIIYLCILGHVITLVFMYFLLLGRPFQTKNQSPPSPTNSHFLFNRRQHFHPQPPTILLHKYFIWFLEFKRKVTWAHKHHLDVKPPKKFTFFLQLDLNKPRRERLASILDLSKSIFNGLKVSFLELFCHFLLEYFMKCSTWHFWISNIHGQFDWLRL